MKTISKKYLIVVSVVLGVFIISDFEYLWFNLKSVLGFRTNGLVVSSAPQNSTDANTASSTTFISSPATTTAPSKPASGSAVTKPKTRPPEISPYTIKIPSLNISVPMVYVYAATEKEFQAGLIDGVVHYPGTALPGEFGNCYIFGHSSDYIWSQGKYKTIFAPLPKTTIGTEIVISDNQGVKFVYTVIDSKKVSAKDLSVLKQDYTKKILTLQTSYPVGTALARWVVVAEMK